MNNKIAGILVGIIILLLLLVAFFVGGDSTKTTKSDNQSDNVDTIMANLQSESEAVKEDEKGEFIDHINVSKFDELFIQEGGKNLVLVARPTCGYCELVEPIIRKIIKDYDLQIYYLNTDDFNDEDNSKFIKYNNDWSDGYGTPMLLLVGDNKIIDIVDGAYDTAHYIEFLKGHSLIKE